jgi:metal-responsive CopG/Arc/MetJ family transcriptional regulator
MKRTTISLSDDLALAVQGEAKRQSASVSEVVRKALAEYLRGSTAKRQISFAGLGARNCLKSVKS